MLHAVSPVFDKRFLKKYILLGCKRILELSGLFNFYKLPGDLEPYPGLESQSQYESFRIGELYYIGLFAKQRKFILLAFVY